MKPSPIGILPHPRIAAAMLDLSGKVAQDTGQGARKQDNRLVCGA
jgi:hypothetical protein